MNKNNNSSTAERILDVAQDLLQRKGFNGFSYQDIAERIEIRKASIHYHFPAKTDLVISLCERYVNQFVERLHQLEQKNDSCLQRIKEMFRFFARISRDQEKLCPITMLSAEIEVLPQAARLQLQRFITETERWLGRTLEQGKRNHELHYLGSFQSQSRILLATLQGAMLITRATGERGHFQNITDDLLKQLQSHPKQVSTSTPVENHALAVAIL